MDRKATALTVVIMMGAWLLCSCTPPTIPVEVDLGNSSLAEFELQAGVPARETAQFQNFNAQVTIGSGSFEIDPSAISVVTVGSVAGKTSVAAQQLSCNAQVEAEGVFTTCRAEGSTEEVCEAEVAAAILACLGDVQTLEVTGWIGSPEESDTIFETGDQYGPYRVTLDENGQGVSVSPSSTSLTPKTINLLNTGDFSVGFELILGQDATAIVDSFTLNLGL